MCVYIRKHIKYYDITVYAYNYSTYQKHRRFSHFYANSIRSFIMSSPTAFLNVAALGQNTESYWAMSPSNICCQSVCKAVHRWFSISRSFACSARDDRSSENGGLLWLKHMAGDRFYICFKVAMLRGTRARSSSGAFTRNLWHLSQFWWSKFRPNPIPK